MAACLPGQPGNCCDRSGIIAVVSILGDHLEDIRGIVVNVFGETGGQVFDVFTGKLQGVADFVTGLFSEGGVSAALALQNTITNLFGENCWRSLWRRGDHPARLVRHVPDTLITCVYATLGGECGVMGWIKTTKDRNRERKWEQEDKQEAKAEAAELPPGDMPGA
ncbi:MAG: hypothetical protein ACLS45_01845 [Subdoligranulum sp.]